MKKVLLLCALLFSVLAVSFTVSANGGFQDSPSLKEGTDLVEDTTGTYNEGLDLVSFGQRDKLPAEIKAALEDAYQSIKNATDLSALNSKLVELTEEEELLITDVAISELFDISADADKDAYKVKVETTSSKYFFCLLHYVNGNWEVVEGARFDANNHLVFEVDSLSPFAIVVINNPKVAVAVPFYDTPLLYVSLALLCTTMFFALKATSRRKHA